MTTNDCPRCSEAQRLVAEACAKHGLRPSRVRDHGEHFCADQSIETWGANTYGHPRVYIQVRDTDLSLASAERAS